MCFVAEPVIRIEVLSFWYSSTRALRDINLEIPRRAITTVFGPAGGGKTTLLRVINRLNDLSPGVRQTGRVLLNGEDIYAPSVDVVDLRRRVGMVFALPLPLPGTIRYNIVYGPTLAGTRSRAELDDIVERSLQQAALWDEVKDRLDDPATALSGGQQQRLCIARSLALRPEVLLLDEPTSGLDPISTSRVEESLFVLREEYSIVIVPHSVQQASRVADYAAFFLDGELVEARPGQEMFSSPQDQRTEDYIVGRFG